MSWELAVRLGRNPIAELRPETWRLKALSDSQRPEYVQMPFMIRCVDIKSSESLTALHLDSREVKQAQPHERSYIRDVRVQLWMLAVAQLAPQDA